MCKTLLVLVCVWCFSRVHVGPGCTAELTCHGMHFFSHLFNKYDEVITFFIAFYICDLCFFQSCIWHEITLNLFLVYMSIKLFFAPFCFRVYIMLYFV